LRKVVVLALILATMSLGVPGGVFAQSVRAAPQAAAISGQAVDAGGRALVNQRIDLVRDGEVVQSTTTGVRGDWSFRNVATGDYVVRTTVNDQQAGMRVSVTSGQTVANALIVAPSAAAPSAAFLAGLGLLGGILTGAAVAAAVITTAVVVTGS
jgi:hypothetical protein